VKALTQDRYGTVALEVVADPVPGDDEVLVEVRAASVNAYDWHVMRGDPYLARLASPSVFGWRGPKHRIRGRDVAGRVAAVGRHVTGFQTGDEVFGDLGQRDGAFAEYVAAPAAQLVRKPANLTFEEAAAVPLAGNTALMGLRDFAAVHSGQHVLVNGASGGVGTFAVQLAKAFGAEVTAVCRTRNVELVRGLGADHVVDYTRDDFATRRYDVVLDLVGNRSLADLRRAADTVVIGGGGVSRGGSLVGPMGLVIRSQLSRPFVRQRLVLLTEKTSAANLATLRDLVGDGQVRPVIDRTFPLTEAAEAIRYVEVEHARAKVVVTV
jgi:NADPH:quinone reductase-like Zn-dependent oxidoreductase